MTPRLIQTQSPSPHLSVSVWRESLPSRKDNDKQYQYRKIWKDVQAGGSSSWLSWAHHEHLMLSLLSQRSIDHVVKVSGLQVADTQVDLVTLDAGPDFLRDWLMPSQHSGNTTLWKSEVDAIKWMRACLKALLSLHALGVIHGDLKPDNLCVSAEDVYSGQSKRLDLTSLTLIDFAYALYREAPLKFVLPTDPSRLDYLPDFYRQAIEVSQNRQDPGMLQSVACVNIDLYSLACLLKQTVEPGLSNSWVTWSRMVNELQKTGTQPQKPFSFWGASVFDQPTRSLLKKIETILQRLNIPKDQWNWADTVLPAQAAATPLIDQSTPLIELTPLISRSVMVLPSSLPVIVAQPILDIHVPKTFISSPRALILSGFILDTLIFTLIDRAYNHHHLILTTPAYGWGLLSVVTGLLLGIQTVRILFAPKLSSIKWWLAFQVLLLCAAVYFSMILAVKYENAWVLALIFSQVWIFFYIRNDARWKQAIEQGT